MIDRLLASRRTPRRCCIAGDSSAMRKRSQSMLPLGSTIELTSILLLIVATSLFTPLLW